MPHAGAEFDAPAADAAAVGWFEGSLSAEEEPALAADDAGVEERDASADDGAADKAAPEASIAAPVGFERAVAAAAPALVSYV